MFDRALTEACGLMGDILARLVALFSGITLFPDHMLRNLHASGGLIMGEALMLELGRQIGRQRAHDVVYDAAQAAFTEGRAFRDLLAEDAEVRAKLSPEQVTALLDPAMYTGLCRQFAEEGAARARTTAAALAAVR
jgi:adenylosuccinate lyase